jgi:hypothetical protein
MNKRSIGSLEKRPYAYFGEVVLLYYLADFFIHPHPYFQIDGTFGFFSWFALVTCISMVLFAKALGLLLKRKDTYYDNE